MSWFITYYNKKAFDEIKKMPKNLLAKYIALTAQIEIQGPNLGMPYTRAMGKGLFEIRLKALEGIARIFYCTIKSKEIIILHSFIKKTQKTPKQELNLALKRMKEVNHGN